MTHWGSAAGSALVLLLGATLSCVAPPRGEVVVAEQRSRPAAEPTSLASDPPTGSETARPRGPEEPVPLWPHDPAAPRWYPGDGEETALAFAQEVLGWRDATFEVGEPAHDGTGGVWSFLEEGSGPFLAVLIVTRGGDPADAKRWAISEVTVTDAGDTPFAISVQGRAVKVAFDWWERGTREAELIVTYADSEAAITVSQPPAEFELELPFEPEGPGTVLVKFRDAGNRVVGARGMAVPAGDVVID